MLNAWGLVMLKQLTVNNVGLVQHVDLSLTNGLTVLTGESGAGKSLLLAALGLVLGDRAQSAVLRDGADRAEVCAEFDLSRHPQLRAELRSLDLDDEDRCFIRRIVHREGRSRAFINDSPTTQAALQRFARALVEIHGQQESYRLSQREVQRDLLDDFGCKAADREAAREAYRRWRTAQSKLDALREQAQTQVDRRDLLAYQLEELDALELESNEFPQLETRFRRAAQAQELADAVDRAIAMLDEDPLSTAHAALRGARDDAPSLKAALDCLSGAQDLVEDARRELNRYRQELDVDPAQTAALETRLGQLHEIARKHRVAPEQLETHVESLREALEAIGSLSSNADATEAEATTARAAFEQAAKALRKQRKAAAKRFCAAVSEHIRQLGIADGTLTVRWFDHEGEHGYDGVEFLIVTNPGAEPAPLKQVASGGEQARISLAIAIVAAANTALPCLILDEADVGVGGITADTVGRLLRQLADHCQVLCITHAPQVAVLGHQHLRVFKDDQGTQLTPLLADTRREEIARMLAGAAVTQESRAYADSLLDAASGT